MSAGSIDLLLHELKKLDTAERYKIHKLEVFSSDVLLLIKGLEILQKERKVKS